MERSIGSGWGTLTVLHSSRTHAVSLFFSLGGHVLSMSRVQSRRVCFFSEINCPVESVFMAFVMHRFTWCFSTWLASVFHWHTW
jgi:hypothetical protein